MSVPAFWVGIFILAFRDAAANCDIFIRKMFFSLWKPPGVSERMWSVNLDVSMSGEYQTQGGNSGRPSD